MVTLVITTVYCRRCPQKLRASRCLHGREVGHPIIGMGPVPGNAVFLDSAQDFADTARYG